MIKSGEYISEEAAGVINRLRSTTTRNSKSSLSQHLVDARRETGVDLSMSGLSMTLRGSYKVTDYVKPILENLYKKAQAIKQPV